jgi:hypothetical protein
MPKTNPFNEKFFKLSIKGSELLLNRKNIIGIIIAA